MRQLRHRSEIAFNFFQRHRASVACDVVGSCENDHHSRLQGQHIRPKSNQHLRRGLAADAAIDVWFALKESAELWLYPRVSNRIAYEDDARFVFGGSDNCSVSIAVTSEIGPVLQGLFVARARFFGPGA